MKSLILLLFCGLPFFLPAQNLLMNGGFEEENICLEYAKNCAPEGWISTSLFADYYFDDPPNAHAGTHFTGLMLAKWDKPLLRNFLRSRLLCGLRKGAQYKLEFYVRSKHARLDSAGIFFSSVDLLYQKDKLTNNHPQLFLAADSNLRRTPDWQKVSLVYTASGEEQFINIGDFNRRGHNFGNALPDLNRAYYFFVDNISLEPVNPSEQMCNNANTIKEEEYAFNVRHQGLDRMIYAYSKNPPVLNPLPKTSLQRVDTLVLPDVLFATASYQLNSAANDSLKAIRARTGNLFLDSIVVEGHTDNQGTETANQQLSLNRASSVAAYLSKLYQTTFFTRGWASGRPVADNRTTIGRQKNRRVEIYFYIRE